MLVSFFFFFFIPHQALSTAAAFSLPTFTAAVCATTRLAGWLTFSCGVTLVSD